MSNIIYFDSAAKTIPYQESLNTFLCIYNDYCANPSSIHFEGAKASRQLDKIKEEMCKILHCPNHRIVFTSSATESNNLAIKGYALKYKNRGKHIITSVYEHPSVLEAFEQLKNEFGFSITYLHPNSDGLIDVNNVLSAIQNDTILVSVMAVNNEIGTINPIAEIAKELKNYPKIVFHTDAAQAIGKFNIDYSNVDLITFSSQKIHGLSTGGALLINKKLELLPLLSGGGQEFGLRSGTVDLATAASFLDALKISIKNINVHFESVKRVSDLLIQYLSAKTDTFELNSNLNNPYIVNFSTKTKKGSVVVEALSSLGIMVSSTSACSSHKEKGSYVVSSLGKDEQISKNTIRVSFSYLNTVEEVESLIKALEKIIGEIR